ncbi:sterile alpha motif domain-containing protein 9-like [Mya arenaria]|uniref:sterile alpha motif domain-containing protein 9-like n=1 Tax=Mya arenaria TaxID=6604 RepID=UPI0022DEB6FD|nr:sterile alpha motif domain-containing protein 9-like [Mya arenaria]
MASIVLSDKDESLLYSKAHQLNVDVASDVLRKLVEKKLSASLISLAAFLASKSTEIKAHKKRGILAASQFQLLNAPTTTVDNLDVTLLTYILKNFIPLSIQEEADIDKLRVIRNELAHAPKYRLTSNDIFDRTKTVIHSICTALTEERAEEIEICIKRLQGNELLSKVSCDMILSLQNEAAMDKLLKASENENVQETKLKFRLSAYALEIGRNIDVDVLSRNLLDKGLITEEIHRDVTSEHNFEDQAYILVMHMMNEKHERVLLFCDCISEMNNCLGTILCKNQPNLGKTLKKMERDAIRDILKKSFEKSPMGRVKCEDVHEYIENARRCLTPFSTVRDCVLAEFTDTVFEDSFSSFQGLNWVSSINTYDESELENDNFPLTNMKSEDFSMFVTTHVRKLSNDPRMNGIVNTISNIITNGMISSKVFAMFPSKTMIDHFKTELESEGYNLSIGIKETLISIQEEILKKSNEKMSDQLASFRPFKTAVKHGYAASSTVRNDAAGLTDTVHHFVYPRKRRDLSHAFFMSEAMKFISASINGRQNGTLHFGIKAKENNTGTIVGVPCSLFDHISLQSTFRTCIKRCFGSKWKRILRCLSPLQIINVTNDKNVIELDIEPCSWYLEDNFIQVNFPPWGNQQQKCFLQTPSECRLDSIETINQLKVKEVEIDFTYTFEQRRMLDGSEMHLKTAVRTRLSDLAKRMTSGNKYVTPHFFPHIICGNYSDSNESEQLLSELSSMESVFLSASAVFNFDHSTNLRNNIEHGKLVFDIYNTQDKNTFCVDGSKIAWLDCHGGSDKWFKSHYVGFNNAVEHFVMSYGERILFIFLIFQKLERCDPLYRIAFDFCCKYKDRTSIISDKQENVKLLQHEVRELLNEDIEVNFYTGFSWCQLAKAFSAIFVRNPKTHYRLPTGDGTVTLMTVLEKEKENISDIELISGDECVAQFGEMSHNEQKIKKKDAEESYYKGNEVSWWNFFFKGQVCKRDLLKYFVGHIEDVIKSGADKNRYEIIDIFHQHGAGGTTLGKQLIWHFSQFTNDPSKALKACIVTRVVEKKTAKEIARFRHFGENDDNLIKPVLILADNKTDEDIKVLKDNLDFMSYKRGSKSGKLFCILIVVSRITMAKSYENKRNVLRHSLSAIEISRFEDRAKDVEDLQSLIAFNVMKENFNEEHIRSTVHNIMEGLKEKEEVPLQHISLVCKFDVSTAIPTSVFDEMMGCVASSSSRYNIDELLLRGKPVGLVDLRHRKALGYRQTWNVRTTESLELLLKYRETKGISGVTIISPVIVDEILKALMKKHSKTLEVVVQDLLDFLKAKLTNTSEKEKAVSDFRDTISGLFVTRPTTRTGDTKERRDFSNLIHSLIDTRPEETKQNAYKRAYQLMKYCFEISNNPYVGQHLARLCISFRCYSQAEEAIERAIAVNSGVPYKSILFDTYGQIYKSQMEQVLKKTAEIDYSGEIQDIIKLALTALRHFRRAQELDVINDMTSYFMELYTAFSFLENIMDVDKIVGDKQMFHKFINGYETDVFDHLGEDIDTFRREGEQHNHLTNTLIRIEYELFMKKRPFKDSLSKKEYEKKAVDLRKTYEYIYGEEDQKFMVAETFKSMQHAYRRFPNNLKRVIRKISSAKAIAREKDLMKYLAYNIIDISQRKGMRDLDESVDIYGYMIILSDKLLQLQRKKNRNSGNVYIEPYMYFALLHWPLPSRREKYFSKTSQLGNLSEIIDEWQNIYDERFVSKRIESARTKAATYFALAKGNPGYDFVDQDMIRDLWRKEREKEGKSRVEVMDDDIWNHTIGNETYVRLEGVVDRTGNHINHQVSCDDSKTLRRRYSFVIATYENCDHLRYRNVTFVLGFTWRGPAAFGVNLNESDEGDESSKSLRHVRAMEVKQTKRSIPEEDQTEKRRPEQN